MECIDCPKCYAYAYDTLIRPHPAKELISFGPVIDVDRIKKAAHSLTRDFIRASLDRRELRHLVVMCVERGGVVRPKNGTRNCIMIMNYWLERRLNDLGRLCELHFHHTGGYVIDEPAPSAPSAPKVASARVHPLPPAVSELPLRIRIPKNEESDTMTP
jgi:hypothetical protein